MAEWEYRTITRRRTFGALSSRPGDWDVNVGQILESAGQDGWELVTVVPSSNTSKNIAFTGSSDQELWIFKRPRTR